MASSNRLFSRLSDRRAVFGLLQAYPSRLVIDSAAEHGYDFIFVDCEHGVFRGDEKSQLLSDAANVGLVTMMRMAGHDTDTLRSYVDMGADAVVVPHVSTAEQALQFAGAMSSSVSSRRREDRCLFVIVESQEGVNNVDSILAVCGVDGVFIGPSDLSADFGHRGDYSSSAYSEAFARIEKAVLSSGKLLGTAPHGSNSVSVLLDRGYRLLVVGSDKTLIRDALGQQIAEARRSM